MALSYLHKVFWFIGLLLLQVLILNNVYVAESATPFLYIYLIIKFESNTSRNTLMCWAFVLGLSIDIFSNTPGMNAAATVLFAFMRPTLLRLFAPHDTIDTFTPSMRSLGISPFLKYLISGVLIHHTALICIEFFSLAHLGMLLIRILACTTLTTICILALEGMRQKK